MEIVHNFHPHIDSVVYLYSHSVVMTGLKVTVVSPSQFNTSLKLCLLFSLLLQHPLPGNSKLRQLCTKFTADIKKGEIKPDQLKKARQKGLEMHNMFRAYHGASPMKLDNKLNENAQEQAEMIAKCNSLIHSSNEDRKGQGENLYFSYFSLGYKGKDLVKTAEQTVSSWYGEFCDTGHWPRGGFNHFSQVVWKNSKKLGLGFAMSKDGLKMYVAGRYSPPGNWMGEYDKQVGKLKCPEKKVCKGQKLQDKLNKNSCKK